MCHRIYAGRYIAGYPISEDDPNHPSFNGHAIVVSGGGDNAAPTAHIAVVGTLPVPDGA